MKREPGKPERPRWNREDGLSHGFQRNGCPLTASPMPALRELGKKAVKVSGLSGYGLGADDGQAGIRATRSRKVFPVGIRRQRCPIAASGACRSAPSLPSVRRLCSPSTTSARPVVRLPGSSFSSIGCVSGVSRSCRHGDRGPRMGGSARRAGDSTGAGILHPALPIDFRRANRPAIDDRLLEKEYYAG